MTKAKNKTSPCKKPSAKTKQSAIEEQQELRRDTMTRAFADPEILALFPAHPRAKPAVPRTPSKDVSDPRSANFAPCSPSWSGSRSRSSKLTETK